MAHFAVFIQRVGLFTSWNKATDAEKVISRFMYYLVLFWVLSVFTTPRKGAAWRLGKDVSRYSSFQATEQTRWDPLFKTRALMPWLKSLFCIYQEKYSLLILRRWDYTRAAAEMHSRDPTRNTLGLLTRVSSISRYFFRYFQMLTTLDLFTDFIHVLLFSLILKGIIYFDSWF